MWYVDHQMINDDAMWQVVSVEDPPVREAGQTVADVDELVSNLKDKGFSS